MKVLSFYKAATIFFFFILFLCNYWNIYGQNLIDCGSQGDLFDSIVQKRTIENNQIIYKKIIQNNQKAARIASVVYTLPVVVHVIHNNGAENLSESAIIAGIQNLNKIFRNLPPFQTSDGVDIEIEFCLAKQDTAGNPTNGITRRLSSITSINYYNRNQDSILKTLDTWKNTKFINVWLVKQMNGAGAYAMLPAGHGSKTDGIVFSVGSFVGPTLAHEFGHYLGLLHTFTGGCTNINCLIDGDGVCDTPPDGTNSGRCNLQNTCSTDPNDLAPYNPFRPITNGGIGDQSDLFRNVMDYGSASCGVNFTLGQKERMRISLETFRSSLLSSLGCEEPCNSLITLNNSYLANPTAGLITTFNANASDPLSSVFSYQWFVDGGSTVLGNTTTFNYTFTTGGSHTVRLIVSNGQISCQKDTTFSINVQCVGVNPDFSISPNDTVLSGTSLVFNNTSTTSLPFVWDYKWVVNGIIESSGNVYNTQFNTQGDYEIKLSVSNTSNLCVAQSIKYVHVDCGAISEFEASSQIVSSGTQILFTNSSINATSYTWLLNGVSMASTNNWSYNFTSVGDFVVGLIANNGICRDTFYTAITVFDPLSCGANLQGAHWKFGNSAGLNFNSGVPVFAGSSFVVEEGITTMSSNNGNLLFYGSGKTIYNRLNGIMPNANNTLMGNINATQSVLSIPKPGSQTLYYVFTVDASSIGGTNGFRYSILDMSLVGGLGDIVSTSKNILLNTSATEKLTAAYHGNMCDYWILTHSAITNEFFAYPLTSNGIGSPVVSQVGNVHSNMKGQMKVSPNGEWVALAVGSEIFVYSFNTFTGVISNTISKTASFSPELTYGIEFSPNSRNVFVTSYQISSLVSSTSLYAFDLTASDFLISNRIVYQGSPQDSKRNSVNFGSLQTATDGKIYVSKNSDNTLGVIQSPDLINSPGFLLNGVSLSGAAKSTWGLPSLLPAAINNIQISYQCGSNQVMFGLNSSISNPDSYYWDFGDVGSNSNNYSNNPSPNHTYSTNSTYLVKVIVRKGCLCASGKELVVLPPLCILPINLLLFKANRSIDGDVNVSWEIRNVENVKFYDLEVSVDAVNFINVFRVFSVLDQETFSVKLSKLGAKFKYIRLKKQDTNGSYEYSEIISMEDISRQASIEIFSNPVQIGSNIYFKNQLSDQYINWKLVDIQGKIVRKGFNLINEGISTLGLNKGMYFVIENQAIFKSNKVILE